MTQISPKEQIKCKIIIKKDTVTILPLTDINGTKNKAPARTEIVVQNLKESTPTQYNIIFVTYPSPLHWVPNDTAQS